MKKKKTKGKSYLQGSKMTNIIVTTTRCVKRVPNTKITFPYSYQLQYLYLLNRIA